MKIREIHLPAYGCFTDFNIEFEENKSFCLIYGANESGKTTMLNSLLDLFYDIPKNTPYAFRHGTPVVGATVVLPDGQKISYQKKKGSRKIHLVNADSGSEEIERLKNDLQREVFVNMFGLDHRSLREGGEALIRGRGHLSESIFMAASGINNLQVILQNLNQEADKLYRPQGKKQIVNSLAAEYRMKKAELREVSHKIEDFEHLKDRYERLCQERKEINDEIEELRLEYKRLERRLHLIPKVNQYKAAAAEREKIGEISYLPPTARDQRIKAQTTRGNTISKRDSLKKTIKELNEKRKTLHIPDVVLKNHYKINELQQELGKYRSCIYKELPALEARKESLEREALEKLHSIDPELNDLDQAVKLRLPMDTQLHIKEMRNEWAALNQEITGCEERIAEFDQQIHQKQRNIDDLSDRADTGQLQEILDYVITRGDLEQSLRDLNNEISIQKQGWEDQFAALSLYHGNTDNFLMVQFPLPETIQRWESLFVDLANSLEKGREEQERISHAIEQIESQLKTSLGNTEVYTEEDLKSSRKQRQAGWELIRRILSGHRDLFAEQEFAGKNSLEEAYEKSVMTADQIADFLKDQADFLLKNEILTRQLTENKSKLEELNQKDKKDREQLEKWKREWEQEWSQIPLEKVLPPREMKEWLPGARNLKEDLMEIRANQAKAAQLSQWIGELKQSLNRCVRNLGLASLNTEDSLSVIIAQCKNLLRDCNDREQLFHGLSDDIKDLEEKLQEWKNRLHGKQKAYAAWELQWAEAVQKIPNSERLSPKIADQYLQAINELFSTLDEKERCQDQIREFIGYVNSFQTRVNHLTAIVQPDLGVLEKDQAVLQLHQIYTRASKEAVLLEQVRQQLDDRIMEYRIVWQEIKSSDEQLKNLQILAGCTALEQLPGAEQRSFRAQQLDEQIQTLREEIQQNLPGSVRNLEEFLAEWDGADTDLDLLAVKMNAIDDELKLLEKKKDNVTREYGAADKEYQEWLQNTSEKAADTAQEAEDILTRIQLRAEEYIKYNLAHKILARSIQVYSDKNQAGILRRAGDIFRVLTLNSFASIAIGYEDEKQQVMVGVRPSGEEIKIEAMSDGTVDQLYLALRLANIELYIANNQALPLIMDDLLINFDDERALAILKVLKEIAGQTQIIFFTHHNHLKDLAAAVLSDCLQVHSI